MKHYFDILKLTKTILNPASRLLFCVGALLGNFISKFQNWNLACSGAFN